MFKVEHIQAMVSNVVFGKKTTLHFKKSIFRPEAILKVSRTLITSFVLERSALVKRVMSSTKSI